MTFKDVMERPGLIGPSGVLYRPMWALRGTWAYRLGDVVERGITPPSALVTMTHDAARRRHILMCIIEDHTIRDMLEIHETRAIRETLDYADTCKRFMAPWGVKYDAVAFL